MPQFNSRRDPTASGRPPDSSYESDPEAGGRPIRALQWWKAREHGTPDFERKTNRERAEAWLAGHGANAPVYLRGDVARSLAKVAFEGDRPIEDVSLDDVADRYLCFALGIDRRAVGREDADPGGTLPDTEPGGEEGGDG